MKHISEPIGKLRDGETKPGLNGEPRRMREYAPGRFTGMLLTDDEVRENMRERMAKKRADHEKDLRDFGPQNYCNFCEDVGFIRRSYPVTDERFGKAEPCPRCSDRTAGRSDLSDFERVGIPPGYLRECTLASFEGDRMQRLAREWVTPWPPTKPFLFLAGERGNGKTHLSVAMLRELWEKHRIWGRFAQVTELVATLRLAASPSSDLSAETVLQPLRVAPLLVLDDIGVGKVTEFVDEQLFLLVGFRYVRGMPTIASANPEGAEATDPRIVERLSDMQRATTWTFSGANRRTSAPGLRPLL